ncbi:MAG TPA: Uma2 family endonuclease [Gemmataceae bacterium]
MSTVVDLDRDRTQLIYDRAADRYLQSLPLEHFMESTDQSTQREITVESLALVAAIRPEFQVFSELLVLYPRPGEDPNHPAGVVPDNMVILWPTPLAPLRSFNTPLQQARPTLVLEYVAPSNPRKDYEDNRKRYERDLKVPNYLIFEPEKQKLIVLQLKRGRYVAVKPNDAGRLAIPDLELEVAIVNRWVRFWYRGKLLALPGELQSQLKAKESQLKAKESQLKAKDDQLAASQAEIARLREQLRKANQRG